MKILYFGTVCKFETYNKMMENCSLRTSVAPIVFENALLKGFYENDIEVDIISYPMVPYFPRSKEFHFGGIKEKLQCGYESYYLNTINIPFAKQISRCMDSRKILKKWLRECGDDDVVFTYSIPPFLIKDIIRCCNKNSVKKFAIIPDLLKDMYINETEKSFFTKLKKKYLGTALKLQGEYDGYIYLTKAMSDVVAPGKPYIVMEGIADINSFSHIKKEENRSKAVMYAGMLHEKYGIINLLDAFEKIGSEDAELWLFGDGTAVPEILKRVETNANIKYFGLVDRESILEYEKKAWVLVNPRDPRDEFTKYSFPSKNIEYMLSGTPVMTTRLEGVPNEYYDYVFFSENNDIENIADILKKILSFSEEEIDCFGTKAKNFILNKKDHVTQAKRIIDFIKGVQNDKQNKNRRT